MFRFATALTAACLLWVVPVWAHDAQVLTGAEISDFLVGGFVLYEGGAEQEFFASGKTLYTSGEPSWGNWTVRGDEYCSQWPPSGTWDCYGVRVHSIMIEFVDKTGAITRGFRIE
ncbi:MAG: hypothetical protein AAGA47_09100 [Pseudomonadota bacterium]